MLGRIKKHWKFTTTLFVVSFLEVCIIGLYLSIDVSRPHVSLPQQVHAFTPFVAPPGNLPAAEQKQPAFAELFKEESGIEKRLPKLLHDYFKEIAPADFPPAELVGLLNLEIAQIKQSTLLKGAVVLHINPHQPLANTALKSIAIKKGLLEDEYVATGKQDATLDYEIITQPGPGDTINPAEKMLALTFDDGPDGNTHALLDALDKYEANATFFVLGQKVAGGVGVLQRMIRKYHEIGNHSWSHPDLRKLSPQHVHSQIADTQAAIKNATGMVPTQMRPPYGATNPSVQQIIQSQGLTLAMWSVDTNDWRDRDPELLYQRIMNSAGDGNIILLHDIHAASVQAAIRAIPDLKAQGYQLVTMTQMEAHR